MESWDKDQVARMTEIERWAIRALQAERLYSIARVALGFDDWLDQIPELPPPPALNQHVAVYRPVLVDPSLQPATLCRTLGIGIDRLFIDRQAIFGQPLREPEHPHWIWCHDGTLNRGQEPIVCRLRRCRNQDLGLTLLQGLAFHVQYPEVAEKRFIDLTETVLRNDPSQVACLGPWGKDEEKRSDTLDTAPLIWVRPVSESTSHRKCGSGYRYVGPSRSRLDLS